MKTAKKITLSAVMASLAAVIMLISHFPYLTYAVPAVASLFIMVVVIELDCKWAFGSYLSSAFLAFLFAETESKFTFVLFFGFYPILKCLTERIDKPFIEWIIKVLVFNVCAVLIYRIVAGLFGADFEDLGKFARYGETVLLVLANVFFVLYDFALARMANDYLSRFHNSVARLLKW